MNTNTRHWASITAGILSLAGHTSAASLGSEKYTYDASGNIVEKSIDGKVTKLSYNRSNRILNKQSSSQSKKVTTYDAAGRPVADKTENGETTFSMSYGYGDKVLETRRHGTNTGFFYNAEGQLVGNSVEGKTIPYTWDGNVLAAQDAEVFANEAHATGGIPVVAGGQEIIVSDYLGNTLSQGNAQFTSTAFGEGLEAGRFTGKPFIEGLESYVFANRFYSPVLNRWTTTDPAGFPDGLNNHAYVGNDPLNRIDPLGLTTMTLPAANPQTYTNPSTSKVNTAFNPVTHDNRTTTKGLIDTKISLPSGRYTVTVDNTTSAPGSMTLLTSGDSAIMADGNTSHAGINIETQLTLPAATSGYSWKCIQTILSNVAGTGAYATANNEYLDNNGSTTSPFYPGQVTLPFVRDFPRRPWPANTNTKWRAYVHLVEVNNTTNTILMKKDSGFKYGFDIEK